MVRLFRRRAANPDDVQIPYQVYETVQEPAVRRQRWIVRLIVVLLAVTLVVGIWAVWRNRQPAGDDTVQSPAQLIQSPQANQPPPAGGEPAQTPASGSVSDKPVSQPQ